MARSSGTRVGNGPGRGQWGGNPKGEGAPPFTAETARLAVSRRDDPEAQAARDEVRAAMLNVLVAVAQAGESEAARVTAADKALDRIDGKALARNEHSGPDGAAMSYVIYGEREAESVEAWQAQHQK